MAIGSVLAILDGGTGSENALKTAVAVGKAFSAYVEVLHIQRPIDAGLPAVPDGGVVVAVTEIVEAISRQSHQQMETARGLFATYCVDQGLNVVEPHSNSINRLGEAVFAWNLITGHDNLELAHRGRLFDLLIMAKADQQDGGVDSTLLEAALFDTGRPVLFASDKPPVFVGGKIAIAWDGSREAAHSVGLALPILEAAERVCVVAVADGIDMLGGEELSRYLSRHGVKSEFHALVKDGSGIAGAILENSENEGVDIVVMGAYGHSPIGEYLFGGVTREMLLDGRVPLLMAH